MRSFVFAATAVLALSGRMGTAEAQAIGQISREDDGNSCSHTVPCKTTSGAASLIPARLIAGTFYEDVASVVCQPSSTNVCLAVFPAVPNNKLLTVENVACNLDSSNGRSIIVASIGISASSNGSSPFRLRNIPYFSAAGFLGYRLNSAIGQPYMKVGIGRFVVVRMNLGGDFPYNGSGSCTITGELSDS